MSQLQVAKLADSDTGVEEGEHNSFVPGTHLAALDVEKQPFELLFRIHFYLFLAARGHPDPVCFEVDSLLCCQPLSQQPAVEDL